MKQDLQDVIEQDLQDVIEQDLQDVIEQDLQDRALKRFGFILDILCHPVNPASVSGAPAVQAVETLFIQAGMFRKSACGN